MKRISRERQRTVESTDAATFDALFNEALEELHGVDVEVIRNMSKGTHCAYLVWKEVQEIPENIRDEYILRGDERHCGECPDLQIIDDGRVKYFRCPMADKRRKEDPACLRYYRKLEEVER